MQDELDVVKELTVEEMGLSAIASGLRCELLKCRYDNGSIYYLVIDDNGGFQCDTIGELKEYMGVEE